MWMACMLLASWLLDPCSTSGSHLQHEFYEAFGSSAQSNWSTSLSSQMLSYSTGMLVMRSICPPALAPACAASGTVATLGAAGTCSTHTRGPLEDIPSLLYFSMWSFLAGHPYLVSLLLLLSLPLHLCCSGLDGSGSVVVPLDGGLDDNSGQVLSVVAGGGVLTILDNP